MFRIQKKFNILKLQLGITKIYNNEYAKDVLNEQNTHKDEGQKNNQLI